MFDPLIDKKPAANNTYPDSYWASTAGNLASYPTLEQDIEADVAIIGGGFAGLSCAYHLAKFHNIKATVLEANEIGWGCSGRNGGFVLNGTGRLSFPQMQKKWGNDTAQRIYKEFRSAICTVDELIEQGNIQCDIIPGGYLKVAHKANLIPGLQQQARILSSQFNDPVQFIDAEQLKSEYLAGTEAHGALYFPYSFGIHPLKLAQGYATMTTQAGADIYTHSAVNQWTTENNQHLVHTDKGTVRAKKVVIASNGYTINRFHSCIDNRHFPVLSTIIVTKPLTQEELAACGFKPGLMVMDTRELKYYYRLLPDNRILFGGRGAIQGKHADDPIYQQRLLAALRQSFPQLSKQQVDYCWSGWVSVSFDDYPRICQADEQGSIYYSMGYCGSGVSFTAQAGKRLAQRIAGEDIPDLPFMHSPLPKFPLSPLRRMGLWGFYHLGRFKDNYF